MGFWCDIIIFLIGGIFLFCVAVGDFNIRNLLIISGTGLILLSVLSFFFFPYLRMIEIPIILVFLVYHLCNLLVHIAGEKSDCPDMICVPGAQVRNGEICSVFRRRLDLALDLYHKYHETPYMAVCGGAGPDETVPEAQSGSEYLIANGADPEKIILERTSRNTFESFINVSLLLQDKNTTVLIATSAYGVLRAALLAKKAGLKAKVIGCADPFPGYICYSFREILAVIYHIVNIRHKEGEK